MGGRINDQKINSPVTECENRQLPLRFLTINVCGLKSKLLIPEFQSFIQDYDIVGIQEYSSGNQQRCTSK